MKATYLIIVIVVTAMGRSRGDPNHEIVMNQLDVTVDPANPYFGLWSAVLIAKDTVILRTPINAPPPPELMVQVKMTLDGDEIPEVEDSLCNMFLNEFLGKEVVSFGVPKGEFPERCPIKPSGEYAVMNYKFPAMKIPAGTEGDFNTLITAFMPGEKPIITINAAGKIGQKVPGAPKLG